MTNDAGFFKYFTSCTLGRCFVGLDNTTGNRPKSTILKVSIGEKKMLLAYNQGESSIGVVLCHFCLAFPFLGKFEFNTLELCRWFRIDAGFEISFELLGIKIGPDED